MERKLISKQDIIPILIILIISLGALLYGSTRESGKIAQIKADGNIIMSIDLSEDGVYYPDKTEYPVTITVSDGEIAVSESGCPTKVCVHTGYIGAVGEMIVCLPNKLTVEIIGGEAEYDLII